MTSEVEKQIVLRIRRVNGPDIEITAPDSTRISDLKLVIFSVNIVNNY